MARDLEVVRQIIGRMHGPPGIEVALLDNRDPPFSFLEWWRRPDGRLRFVFRVHPYDLNAEWEDLCAEAAHELGHTLGEPPQPDGRTLGRLQAWPKPGLARDLLWELWELVTGRTVRREAEADRNSLSYLRQLGYGTNEVLQRYRHDARRFAGLPRALRWLARYRLWRQKKLFLLKAKPFVLEALWV